VAVGQEARIRMAEVPAAQESPGYFLPNKMGRIVLLSLDEVMGRNGVNAVLNLARLQDRIENYPPNNFDKDFGFDELGQMLQALDEMYGPRGGRGLARRAGQACFKLGIIDFGLSRLALRDEAQGGVRDFGPGAEQIHRQRGPVAGGREALSLDHGSLWCVLGADV
jgi:hypothetical protein